MRGLLMAEPMPREADTTERLDSAKTLMEDALQLLDDCGAPADIGAHLDLAIHRLSQLLDQTLQLLGPNPG